MVRKPVTDLPVMASSGNVFADLGLPDPDHELTKAQLASQIRQVIKRRRLTQVAAASAMGIDQPKVSALLNGRLGNFSSERLMRLLTALGQDVEITVKTKPRNRAQGCIRVVGEVHV
jgi:predicted XRE-type DNA-binding protein